MRLMWCRSIASSKQESDSAGYSSHKGDNTFYRERVESHQDEKRNRPYYCYQKARTQQQLHRPVQLLQPLDEEFEPGHSTP